MEDREPSCLRFFSSESLLSEVHLPVMPSVLGHGPQGGVVGFGDLSKGFLPSGLDLKCLRKSHRTRPHLQWPAQGIHWLTNTSTCSG